VPVYWKDATKTASTFLGDNFAAKGHYVNAIVELIDDNDPN